MNKLRFRIVLLALSFAVAPSAHAQGLRNRIEQVIYAPVYRHSTWGILVVDVKTGEQIYALNEDKLVRPASVTKLYSVAAALEALGPDHRFRTPVYRTADVDSNGTLKGDLILVASGDPTMGGRGDSVGKIAFKDTDHIYAGFMESAEVTDTNPLAGLDALSRQVAESGIRRVTGDVVIDDRLFDRAEGGGSGPVTLTPIVVNDNLVDIVITPGSEGEAAQVRWIPQSAVVQVDARVITAPADSPAMVNVTSPSPGRVMVRGQIPMGRKPLLRIREVEDPASFARSLFVEALHRAGVTVDSSIFARNSSDRLPSSDQAKALPQVAELVSPPFAEHAKLILKVSHNLHAGILPLLLATREGKRTLDEGLRIGQRYLKELGVSAQGISFGSAAGGAQADLTTASVTVELLRKMAARPDPAVFENALPILGVDGTLAETVPTNSPARGKVRAKTGTYVVVNPFNGNLLLTSKALAGYLEAKSGRRLAFALFVNNVAPAPDDGNLTLAIRHGRALGKLCEILYDAL